MLTGSCLCGAVRFEVEGEATEFYQCHCSLCRKSTGSAAVTALLVAADRVRWVSGPEHYTFSTRSGYRVDFCKACGSPIPNRVRSGDYWIPAGLLDGDVTARVTKHIYVGSQAPWDVIPAGVPQFEHGPP